jgi:hypothetical protein
MMTTIAAKMLRVITSVVVNMVKDSVPQLMTDDHR